MNMPGLFDLTGQVAIVTGGNRAIGRGIALGLAQAGAAVAVFGRNEEKNQQVLAELKAIGVHSVALKVDMTNRSGLEPALNTVESELGAVSILVNNAGNVSLSGGVMNERPEDWDCVIETQLNSVFLLSRLWPLIDRAARSSTSAACIRTLARDSFPPIAPRKAPSSNSRSRWRLSWPRTTFKSTQSRQGGLKPT